MAEAHRHPAIIMMSEPTPTPDQDLGEESGAPVPGSRHPSMRQARQGWKEGDMDEKAATRPAGNDVPRAPRARDETWFVPPIVIPAVLVIGFAALLLFG
ncbi:MAG TPA: hypothetical protein VED40_20250 [Azospirillaceae bacterium]|nr:hypothetical protein [Azospirillaceae bacterium]